MGIYILAFGVFLVVSFITWATANLPIIIGGVVLIIVILVWNAARNKKRLASRLAFFTEKYKSEEIAQGIMSGQIWRGQTEEQLLESMGSPVDKDQKLLKTKTKDIWKYHEVRKGQFALRITVENGKVATWDKKS